MPVMDERGLPTNVIDELNRLVREVEDKANRPPGVRHKRERTDGHYPTPTQRHAPNRPKRVGFPRSGTPPHHIITSLRTCI